MKQRCAPFWHVTLSHLHNHRQQVPGIHWRWSCTQQLLSGGNVESLESMETGHLDSMEFNGIQWNSMEFNGIQWNPIGLRNPEIHGMVRNGSMASHRVNGSTQRPPAHVWPGPSRLLRAFFPAPRQKNPSGTSYCSNTEAEKPMEKPHQRSIHFSIEKNPIRSVCAAYPATDSSLPWLRKRHGRLPQLPGRFIKTWQWQKYGGLVRKIIEMVNFPHYQRVHYCRSRG